MAGMNQEQAPQPKQANHLDCTATIIYSCGACKSEIGTPDVIELTKDTNFRGEIPAESGECKVCQAPLSRKKIVVCEP